MKNLLLKQVQAEGSGGAAAEMSVSSLRDYREAAALRTLRRIRSFGWSWFPLFSAGSPWSLRSRNKVIGKTSHVAPETERTNEHEHTKKMRFQGMMMSDRFFQSINTVILSQLNFPRLKVQMLWGQPALVHCTPAVNTVIITLYYRDSCSDQLVGQQSGW